MASGFPGSIDNFTDPLTTSALNSPSHAGQHQDLNDAVEKIETYMGLVKVIPTSVTGGTLSADGTITATNGQATITVGGCFSALYRNYRVVANNLRINSGTIFVDLQLRTGGTTSTTGYYHSRLEVNTGGTVSGSGATNDSLFRTAVVIDATNASGGFVEIYGPQLAQTTTFQTGGIDSRTSGAPCRIGGCFHNSTTQFTDLVISLVSSSFASGTFCIYGYRN